MSQTHEEYTEREEQIFQAAIQEFARNGKQGARMKAIADEAGVNKALVHYYFRNKENLFQEVFDYVYLKFFNCLNNAVKETGTFAELLKSFINVYFDFLDHYDGFYMLLKNELEINNENIQTKYRELVGRLDAAPSQHFSERITVAIKNGEIRQVDPFQTFISLLGACNYFFIGYPILSLANPEIKKNRKKYIEERKAHIFDLFYNGLKNE